jgi:hypothetical protein
MESTSAYGKKNKYFTSYCIYSKTTINATRPVLINWKESNSRIIEISLAHKDISINLEDCIKKDDSINKKKLALNKKRVIFNKKQVIFNGKRAILRTKQTVLKKKQTILKKKEDYIKKGDDIKKERMDIKEEEEDIKKEEEDIKKESDDLAKERADFEKERYDLAKETFDIKIESCPKINETFWSMISRVKLYDTDEIRITKSSLFNKFTKHEMEFLIKQIDNVYIPILKNKLIDVPLLQSVDIINHNNILSHIICKGQLFYEGILGMPEVSLYLYNKFYPVYDWLSNN